MYLYTKPTEKQDEEKGYFFKGKKEEKKDCEAIL